MTRACSAALFGALAATTLGACHVGPNYERPRTPVAANAPFLEASPATLTAQTSPTWWRLYADSVLDGLIADAFAANTDLRVALANISRARGTVRSARGERFPSTTANGGYSYGQSARFGGSGGSSVGTSGTGTGGTGSGTGTGGTGGTGTGTTTGVTTSRLYSLFDLGFSASYEADIFGRVSRSIEAARRDVEAAQANRDDVRVIVAADTALEYANACSGAEQIAVARRSLALLDRSLQLTQLQFQEGRGNRLDVERARALREQQAATIPTLQANRAAALYALAALTGRVPAELPPAARTCTRTPALALPIPIGDGTALITRRPDIRRSERTLAADTARIGIATAALYPRVTLGGSAGLTSNALRTLFTGNAFNFLLGPAISWAFPNQEVARGQILSARGQAAISLATFDGTVLNALRDTETALSVLARELDRAQSLGRARDAAAQAAQLSRLRFTEGRDDFLTELDADRTLATAEAALAQSRQLIADDQVQVFRQLGGGWENTPPDPRERKPEWKQPLAADPASRG